VFDHTTRSGKLDYFDDVSTCCIHLLHPPAAYLSCQHNVVYRDETIMLEYGYSVLGIRDC
jgi:hypothetical protein